MHKVVVGLMFGDEGKGATVDFLCSQQSPRYVVRFSGGPQTAHNVILPDGKHHTFSQFGSGSLRGIQTLMTRYTLINPLVMVDEARCLEKTLESDRNLLFDNIISEDAILITNIHRWANIMREKARGRGAHGSCGHGVGESMLYATQYPEKALYMRDLRSPEVLLEKLTAYAQWAEENLTMERAQYGTTISDDYSVHLPSIVEETIEELLEVVNREPFQIMPDKVIMEEMKQADHLIFEGSQGVLLDEWYGLHPHTTWSTTTPQNAMTLLEEAGITDYEIYGAVRSYSTRHGYGPFPTEFHDPMHVAMYPELHNQHGELQGAWRVGAQDVNLLEYAIKVAGRIDKLAVSHLDVTPEGFLAVEHTVKPTPAEEPNLDYQEEITNALLGITTQDRTIIAFPDEEAYLAYLVDKTGVPVGIIAHGATSDDRAICHPLTY